MIGKSNNFKNQNNMKNFNSNSANESNNLSTISTADEMKKVSGSCTLNMSFGAVQISREKAGEVFEMIQKEYNNAFDLARANGLSVNDWYNTKEYKELSEARRIFFNAMMKK